MGAAASAGHVGSAVAWQGWYPWLRRPRHTHGGACVQVMEYPRGQKEVVDRLMENERPEMCCLSTEERFPSSCQVEGLGNNNMKIKEAY